MKNDVDALYRRARHSWFAQIGLQEVQFASSEVVSNIVEVSARQIIRDSDFLDTSRNQMVRERRSNEGRSAGYQCRLSRPKRFCGRHSWFASRFSNTMLCDVKLQCISSAWHRSYRLLSGSGSIYF